MIKQLGQGPWQASDKEALRHHSPSTLDKSFEKVRDFREKNISRKGRRIPKILIVFEISK